LQNKSGTQNIRNVTESRSGAWKPHAALVAAVENHWARTYFRECCKTYAAQYKKFETSYNG